MPYTGPDDKKLPSNVLACKERAKRSRWVAIWNNVFKRTNQEKQASSAANAILMTSAQMALSCMKAAAIYIPTSQYKFTKLSATAGQEKTGPFEYKKGVLPRGSYAHPLTGKRMEFHSEMQHLSCSETNRFINDGNQCSFPEEHTAYARANMGWWKPEFAVEGTESVGRVAVSLSSDAEKIDAGNIKYVSPLILPYWMDAQEREYEQVMVHVCATSRPVMPGQTGFDRIELSLSGTKRSFSVIPYSPVPETGKKGKVMDIKKMALKLGLGDDATEEQIETALDTMLSKPTDESGDKKPDSAALALSATVAQLTSTNKALEDRLKIIEGGDKDNYMDAIQKEAIALGIPMEKADVAEIDGYFKSGHAAFAKKLGFEKMTNIRLRAKKAPEGSTALSAASGSATEVRDKEQNARENRAYKKMVESQGGEVKLSADCQDIEVVRPIGGKKK